MSNELTMLELVKLFNEADPRLECFNDIGRIQQSRIEDYKWQYNHFLKVNSQKYLNGVNNDKDNKIKGEALENLVQLLFEVTGGYFECYKNLRTGTNEIDLLLRKTNKARTLDTFISNKYDKIICECKNYSKTVGVTYIGKFYSLMVCSFIRFGIMFSHHGISGTKWNGGTGLTKKVFMLREDYNCKQYILDFNKDDFGKILSGTSLFKILDDKCLEMETDIDISNYIQKHPNEDCL